MTHYLITGGAGFIGSHVVDACLNNNFRVTVVDNLRTGSLKNIQQWDNCSKFNFINADVDKPLDQKIFKNVDHVCHLAARISVPESFDIPESYFMTNTIGSTHILHHAKQHCKSITLASTAAIYGNDPALPKNESMIPKPQSPYAISKLDGEHLISITNNDEFIGTSLRFFNVFGPRQQPDSAYAAAVPIFIDRALNNKDITIYGDGEQTRDFIYVKDIANICLQAGVAGGGVFNAACGHSISIKNLAKMIIDLTSSKSSIIYKGNRTGDIKHSCADITKLTTNLGANPNTDLKTGLIQTIEHYQSLLG